MRLAIYARLSVSQEASVSIERQLEACRAYAKLHGHTVTIEATDDGVSATKVAPLKRAGFGSLMDSRVEWDAVLAWKLDRLLRRVNDLSSLTEAGVPIISATEPFDATTPMGKAMLQISAVFAELESATIRARVTAAQATIRRQGRIASGRCPWPLDSVENPNGPGKVWRPNADRAPHVVAAVDALIAGTTTINAIARQWGREGLPTSAELRDARHGREVAERGWNASAVRKILTNPALYGARTHKNLAAIDADGLPIVDAEQAVISRATFTALQAALAERGRSVPRVAADATEAPASILQGVLFCGVCGGKMFMHRTTRGSGNYRCHGTARNGSNCPATLGITARVAERVVIDHLIARAAEPVTAWEEVDDSTRRDALVEVIADLSAALTSTTDEAEVVAIFKQRKARQAELAALPVGAMRRRVVVEGVTLGDLLDSAGEDARALATVVAGAVSRVVVAQSEGGRKGRPSDAETARRITIVAALDT